MVNPSGSPGRGVALVTGAARRIGRAVALRLAADGWDVAVHFHTSAADAASTVDAVRARGRRAGAFRADLADGGAPAVLVGEVERALGPVALLVNGASVFPAKPFPACDPEDYDLCFAVNARAPLLLARAVAPGMRERGRGRIVNLGDLHGERPLPDRVPYVVSKAALHMATLALARELAPHVQVNAVAPGAVLPPDDADPDLAARLVRRIPAGRLGTPEEIADVVAFLAAGPAFLTGEVIRVDGGRHLAP